ncbi:unnamed protein product [Acanthoscelides obtectus]|uniref:Uncharacterized protein n=1 Tax=Acanthoscelides obtectus TaxID=200917 RepID=A0A9P0NWK6_ACAOB|nr:unnamed protein product [Acanthoscelides obtectus]
MTPFKFAIYKQNSIQRGFAKLINIIVIDNRPMKFEVISAIAQ